MTSTSRTLKGPVNGYVSSSTMPEIWSGKVSVRLVFLWWSSFHCPSASKVNLKGRGEIVCYQPQQNTTKIKSVRTFLCSYVCSLHGSKWWNILRTGYLCDSWDYWFHKLKMHEKPLDTILITHSELISLLARCLAVIMTGDYIGKRHAK